MARERFVTDALTAIKALLYKLNITSCVVMRTGEMNGRRAWNHRLGIVNRL